MHSTGTLDPVPVFESAGDDVVATDAFDEYRYGRGKGEYLYLFYFVEQPLSDASDIVPMYVGETKRIMSRLHQHLKKLRKSLPVDE